jgi:hypothetical protein
MVAMAVWVVLVVLVVRGAMLADRAVLALMVRVVLVGRAVLRVRPALVA